MNDALTLLSEEAETKLETEKSAVNVGAIVAVFSSVGFALEVIIEEAVTEAENAGDDDGVNLDENEECEVTVTNREFVDIMLDEDDTVLDIVIVVNADVVSVTEEDEVLVEPLDETDEADIVTETIPERLTIKDSVCRAVSVIVPDEIDELDTITEGVAIATEAVPAIGETVLRAEIVENAVDVAITLAE